MKKIFLFLSLIFFFAHEINGAAKNMAEREQGSCFTQSETNDVTVSDCVDRKLTHDDLTDYGIVDNGGYYDKCCYFRAMAKGTYIYGCIGLDRDDTIDVIDSIDAAEKELAIEKIEAEKLVVKAQAEKEANEIISSSLTNEVLLEHFLEKWNGELPEYVGFGDEVGITKMLK